MGNNWGSGALPKGSISVIEGGRGGIALYIHSPHLQSLPVPRLRLTTFGIQRGGDAVKVDLQRNRLKQISGITQLKNLTELNLCRNEFTDFPTDIRGLHQLEKLYINQNNIKTIPENVFPSLEKLRFLKLSTNRLEKLPQDMNRCQHLNYLNLSNNCLRNLDPLVGLSHLKELYVERNQLADLPDLLFQNSSLTLFKANGNPLRKPPQEGIRFIFWDFAGQEEYYITHHVFITAQAFVILAINLSR
uniref:Uncharacterized protein n=1 Tax=Sinocyclocheilus anshuiensis TaxID=1608454 RepID=A0A671P9G2_9TELE